MLASKDSRTYYELKAKTCVGKSPYLSISDAWSGEGDNWKEQAMGPLTRWGRFRDSNSYSWQPMEGEHGASRPMPRVGAVTRAKPMATWCGHDQPTNYRTHRDSPTDSLPTHLPTHLPSHLPTHPSPLNATANRQLEN